MITPPLSHRSWARVAPCLPRGAATGRPRVDPRLCLEAVLFVLLNGCRWCDLPVGGIAPMTAWRHLRHWQETGTWPRIWRAYLESLDAPERRLWAKALLAGAFLPTHKDERRGAPRTRRRKRAVAEAQ